MNKDEQFLQKAKKMGGYDRIQVLDYIKQMRDEQQAELDHERKQFEELREAYRQLEGQLVDLTAINAQLNDRLYQEQRHAGELNLAINKLNIEISGQRVEINERERVNMSLQSEFSELKNQTQILEEKAKRYEQLKCKVGDMMLEAKSSADRLLSNANRQAAEIMQDAKKQAEVLVGQAHRYVTTINQDIMALKNQLAAGRRYAAEMTEGIINSFNSVELVVNSIDFSINRDDEFETELDLLTNIIAESHNKQNNIQDQEMNGIEINEE